jgi:Na+-driven multidrug efflux pump
MKLPEQFGRRLAMTTVGVALSGVAVGFFQASVFGVDPFQCFATGLWSLAPGMSYGLFYMLLNLALLVVDVLLEVGRTSNIFAGSTLRATGDTVYPFVVGVVFQWSVAVGLAYVLGIPLGLGLVGMWIGFALDENIRGVILLRRWRSGRWRSKGFVGSGRS